MTINKSKSGIMFYNKSRTVLAQWEKDIGEIMGYPVIDKYKYLGVWINKSLGMQSQYDHLVKKIKKYEKLSTIINL